MQATCHFILLFLFLPSDIPRRQSACSCPLSDALFNLFVRASDLKEERAMCKRSHKGKAVVGASINYTAQSPRPSVNLQPTVFQCLCTADARARRHRHHSKIRQFRREAMRPQIPQDVRVHPLVGAWEQGHASLTFIFLECRRQLLQLHNKPKDRRNVRLISTKTKVKSNTSLTPHPRTAQILLEWFVPRHVIFAGANHQAQVPRKTTNCNACPLRDGGRNGRLHLQLVMREERAGLRCTADSSDSPPPSPPPG